MAIFVQGTRGAGKSKRAVAEIRDALKSGHRVATNLDIFTDKLLGPDDPCKLVRLPDFPRSEDFFALGLAYPELDSDDPTTYDESKFGLIVLDETLSFFNTRSWNDKDRLAAIQYLTQCRKYGWRLWMIGQDVEGIDKQIRGTLLDYVYDCRSSKRLFSGPVGTILQALIMLFTLGRGLPQFHVCSIYEGQSKSAKRFDGASLFRHNDLIHAYNTAQKFRMDGFIKTTPSGKSEFVDMRASYSVLPPKYLKPQQPQAAEPVPASGVLRLPYLGLSLAGMALTFALGLFLSGSDAVPVSPLPNSQVKTVDGQQLDTTTFSDVVVTATIARIRGDVVSREYLFERNGKPFEPAYHGLSVVGQGECMATLTGGVHRVDVHCAQHVETWTANPVGGSAPNSEPVGETS